MNRVSWHIAEFNKLNPVQLYAALQLRTEVFVMEQNCVFQDMDGCDQDFLHLLGDVDGDLICYARIAAPGIKYSEAVIGRVITHPTLRGKGYGKELMREAVRHCEALWPGAGIKISAQQHLEAFYQDSGFLTVSDPYDEDGIPHVEMLRK